VQDRGSIKNQKSKTLSPHIPQIIGQSIAPMQDRWSIKNQKSKIKNPLDSPPSAGSGVNQKSKIKNLVAHIPQIISRTPGQDRSSI
jgi:hypothetical protein